MSVIIADTMYRDINKIDFILASSSPRRRKLLKDQGYRFKVVNPKVSELFEHKYCYKKLAMENSRMKAASVARSYPGSIVLSADTIVVLSGKVLGKAKNKKDALSMLLSLNNKTHQVISAYSILKYSKSKLKVLDEKAVSTKVSFGDFSKKDYQDYISTKEYIGKAGAYGIQDLATRFVKKLSGSYTNVVGLPLYELMISLKKAGVGYPWN